MNNKKINTIKDGKQVEYDVVLTFKNEDNQKDYIVYTDNSVNEKGKLKIYAAVYNPLTLEFLGNPTSQEEWNAIYKLLDETFETK